MTAVVADASAVVGALVHLGSDGTWARQQFADADLSAPHLMLGEASNTIRRQLVAGQLREPTAAEAHRGLVRLSVELFPFAGFADRVWELRHNLTSYDAWYVSLAEALAAPLITLDRRLAAAPDLGCEVECPPAP